MSAVFGEAVPGVGAFEPLLAQALASPVHVAGGVGGLHRGDHAEFGEARNVGGRQDLGVFEAVAARVVRVVRRHALQCVEHLAVGAVADGVHAHLQAA